MTDPRSRFLEARDRLDALVAATDDAAFNAKPAARSWSAAECVVHLNKTHEPYLPVLEAKAALSSPTGSGPFRYGYFARRFIDGMAPGGRPVPTAGGLKPPPAAGDHSDIDVDRAVARFRDDVGRLLAAMDDADGLDLARVKMRSPVMPVVRFSLGAFFELLANHALRHVAQAERAVEATSG